jgi:hypothetical protein
LPGSRPPQTPVKRRRYVFYQTPGRQLSARCISGRGFTKAMPGAEGPLLLCDPNGLAERRSNLGLVSTHSSGKYTGGRAVRDTANIEKIRQWTKRPHCIVSGKMSILAQIPDVPFPPGDPQPSPPSPAPPPVEPRPDRPIPTPPTPTPDPVPPIEPFPEPAKISRGGHRKLFRFTLLPETKE